MPGYDEKVKFGFMFYFAYKVIGDGDDEVLHSLFIAERTTV